MRPDKYWGMDMTKFLIGPLGWCYLIILLDWFTKEIMGWPLSLRAREAQWKEALKRALNKHFPRGVRGTGV
ncbi:MAG: transposase family protein [Candidatus Aminicenantes bacterium]|nr:transposase family protein [Candidatus Aminicenantes bacterium]